MYRGRIRLSDPIVRPRLEAPEKTATGTFVVSRKRLAEATPRRTG